MSDKLKDLVNQIQEEILRDEYIIEFSEESCDICLKDKEGNRYPFGFEYTSAVH